MKYEPVILIADSKEVFDEMVPVVSEKLGTTQIIHADSRAAAESLLDAQIHFDLIFVDWQLVGSKFVDTVRSNKINGCTPLLVMSELDTDVVIATATRHGASGFLAKPFLTKGLVNKIDQIVARGDRRRKQRLCPDHAITISVDTERAGEVAGVLLDFSLDYCHIRLDKSQREVLIVNDRARIPLHIDRFKVDMEGQLVRVEQDSARVGESILVLYKFSESLEDRSVKLAELLDEYQGQW